MSTKKCTKCNERKSLDSFYSNMKTTDKRQSWCKDCTKKARREARAHNCAYHKAYRNTLRGRFLEYIHTARVRGIIFNLSLEQFATFWQIPCYFCGDPVDGVRLDRLDSTRGYEMDNIVSSCSMCNYMKNDYTEQEFYGQIKKIAGHKHVS